MWTAHRGTPSAALRVEPVSLEVLRRACTSCGRLLTAPTAPNTAPRSYEPPSARALLEALAALYRAAASPARRFEQRLPDRGAIHRDDRVRMSASGPRHSPLGSACRAGERVQAWSSVSWATRIPEVVTGQREITASCSGGTQGALVISASDRPRRTSHPVWRTPPTVW